MTSRVFARGFHSSRAAQKNVSVAIANPSSVPRSSSNTALYPHPLDSPQCLVIKVLRYLVPI
jgi:hypothetical protein